MTFEYEKISEKYNVEDKDIAKIINYAERHTKWTVIRREVKWDNKIIQEYIFWNKSYMFRSDWIIEVCWVIVKKGEDNEYLEDLIIMRTDLFAKNHIGLFSAINNHLKND